MILLWTPAIRAEKAELTNRKAKSSIGRDSVIVKIVAMLRFSRVVKVHLVTKDRPEEKGHTLSPLPSCHLRVVAFKLSLMKEGLLQVECVR